MKIIRIIAIPVCAFLFICCASVALMGADGCNKQQTTADLLIIAGNSTAAYCASQGLSDCVAGAQKFAGIVAADVANFVPGTKNQDAIQAIQDFEGIIAAADPNGKLAILDLALSTALSALQVIEANSGPAATPAIQARVGHASSSATANPPQSVKEYKARWNAELASNPIPGLAPLK